MPTIEHKITTDNFVNGIKNHVKKHRLKYEFGSCIVLAGFTCLIMRGRGAGLPEMTASRSETVSIRPFFLFSKDNQVITVIQRMGRGRPGNLTQCVETGRMYASQTLAAESQGVDGRIMFMHLDGKLPDVKGLHYQRVVV